jgi:hypothetical protein
MVTASLESPCSKTGRGFRTEWFKAEAHKERMIQETMAKMIQSMRENQMPNLLSVNVSVGVMAL